MSKLPVVNFKRMDKILRHFGFTAVRQKGIQMAGRQRFPTMEAETLPGR